MRRLALTLYVSYISHPNPSFVSSPLPVQSNQNADKAGDFANKEVKNKEGELDSLPLTLVQDELTFPIGFNLPGVH